MIYSAQNNGVWEVGNSWTFDYYTCGTGGYSAGASMGFCPVGASAAIFTWSPREDEGYDGVYCSDQVTEAPSGLTISEPVLLRTVENSRGTWEYYRITVTIPDNYPTGTYYLRNSVIPAGGYIECLIA